MVRNPVRFHTRRHQPSCMNRVRGIEPDNVIRCLIDDMDGAILAIVGLGRCGHACES